MKSYIILFLFVTVLNIAKAKEEPGKGSRQRRAPQFRHVNAASKCKDEESFCGRYKTSALEPYRSNYCKYQAVRRRCPQMCLTCFGNAECGKRPTYSQRIVGGKETYNTWPWVFSLQVNKTHYCGGSLISNRHGLTAAHCLRESEIAGWFGVKPGQNLVFPFLRAVLGRHKIDSYDVYEQIFKIPKWISGKFFFNLTAGDFKLNDVAVFKLDRPVRLTHYVGPICLAEPGLDIPPGTHVMMVGWGIYKFPKRDPVKVVKYPKRYSKVLRETTLEVIDNEYCSNILIPQLANGRKVYFGHKAGSNVICTVRLNNQGDVAVGDFGGPLMLKYTDPLTFQVTFKQVGIASYKWGRVGEVGHESIEEAWPFIQDSIVKLGY